MMADMQRPCGLRWRLESKQGLLRELSPGPLAPEARIMPLDQAAVTHLGLKLVAPNFCPEKFSQRKAQPWWSLL